MLKPFFTFYGGKWRAAPHYPRPAHGAIVEPFAGSAGYSLRYANREIILIEKDFEVSSVWRYLIGARPAEIRALPDVMPGQTTYDIDVCAEARRLIGFWLNKGAATPRKSPSAWMRSGARPASYWGPEIRERIASQIDSIKHWRIIEGDYRSAPNIKATWFIDPPYVAAGQLYRCSSNEIDYARLSTWCLGRAGQTIVCENEGANWLPFRPFRTIKSTPGRRGKTYSREVLYASP